MMKKLILLFALGSVAGCSTLNSSYHVTEVDSAGQKVDSGFDIIVRGDGVHKAKNFICALNPKATVRITDLETGKEIKSESPYKCK